MASDTRDRILDALERTLVDVGVAQVTLEGVAAAAGVSKGGLLYHFASRDALIDGLVARLDTLVEEDVRAIEEAPEGPIAYFVRSSVAMEHPLDRAVVAAARLAQGGNAAAGRAIRNARRRWLEAIRRHVADPTVALAITLIGDGLYYDSALHGEVDDLGVDAPRASEMDALVALLERLATEPPASG